MRKARNILLMAWLICFQSHAQDYLLKVVITTNQFGASQQKPLVLLSVIGGDTNLDYAIGTTKWRGFPNLNSRDWTNNFEQIIVTKPNKTNIWSFNPNQEYFLAWRLDP